MTDQETEILSTLDESQRTVVLAQDGHHLLTSSLKKHVFYN